MNNEITINGEVYVKKEAEKERVEAKRFPEKTTLKLLNKLTKLFCLSERSINEEEALNGVTVIDPANVCLVTGISEEAKRILALFKDFNSTITDKSNLDYKPFNQEDLIKSRYSQEYIIKIIEILNVTEDAVNIYLNKDYPITLENKDFKFVLAPRVETD